MTYWDLERALTPLRQDIEALKTEMYNEHEQRREVLLDIYSVLCQINETLTPHDADTGGKEQ